MSLVGIHIDDISEIKHYDHNKIKLFQFFVSATHDYDKKEYQEIFQHIKNNNIKIVVHGSYSLNMSRSWKESDWWIQQLINEIMICDKIGSFGIVIHTGKKLDLTTSTAINNMYTSLMYIHEQTLKHQNVKILIETPSGQGTEILTQMDEFCRFMNKFYKHPKSDVRDRFGVCIDTCHIFASGHDIRSLKLINGFFGTIDKTIGIDKIKLCHLNDSKYDLGSKLDRHMTIGKGYIGIDPLRLIVEFLGTLEIPILLETPSKNIIKDFNSLRSK